MVLWIRYRYYIEMLRKMLGMGLTADVLIWWRLLHALCQLCWRLTVKVVKLLNAVKLWIIVSQVPLLQ